jgi:hypothetical protein
MEQQTVSLKQCISKITGKQIAMNGEDFIYLDDKTKVSKEVLDEATLLKSKMEEEQRIQQIKAKCNQAIAAVYPIYKQINITNLLTPYTEQDREVMKAFIDSKRAICHKAISDGTKPEDVDFSSES